MPWKSIEMMLQSHHKQKEAALLETIKRKLSGDIISFKKKKKPWFGKKLFYLIDK